MTRLPRPRLEMFHRRGVLVVGLVLLVLGVLGMLVHGPDDTVTLGEQVQPEASAGLPTVVHPVSTAFGGAELVVRASAPGGVFVGVAHRIDVTDLLEGLRHVEQDSLGLREPTFVEGFEVQLSPEPITGWWDRASGEGVQEVRADLDGPEVDVLAVPVDPRAPVTLTFGVHVEKIFQRAVIIALGGLWIVGMWFIGRLARRRNPQPDPEEPGTHDAPQAPQRPKRQRRWRRKERETFTAVYTPGPGTPAPPPPPAPRVEPMRVAVVLPPPVIQPVQLDIRPDAEAQPQPAPDAPEPEPEPEASSGEAAPESTPAEPSARRPAGRPVTTGVVVGGAAAIALGSWARWRSARRRGTTFLLLLTLLLGGCGLAPDQPDSSRKPGLEPRAVQELLDDYATRRTRAARRATAPRYDGAFWVRAQTGSLLAASQWQSIANRIEQAEAEVPRPTLTGEHVHAPLFRGYPMWAAVEVKEQTGERQLVVFTRERFADPWFATAAVDVAWNVVPAPDPSPEGIDRDAFEAGAAAAELVDTWWEEGSSRDLIVDDRTVALRDDLVTSPWFPPEVTAWPEVDDRRFLVRVKGGGQMLVAVHRMVIGTRTHAVTSLVLLPSVGRPRVLATTVRRTLR